MVVSPAEVVVWMVSEEGGPSYVALGECCHFADGDGTSLSSSRRVVASVRYDKWTC